MARTQEWIEGRVSINEFSEAIEWLENQKVNVELWLKNYLLDFDSHYGEDSSYGSHIYFDENYVSMDPKRDIVLSIYQQGSQHLRERIVNGAKNIRESLLTSANDLERKATESISYILGKI